MNSASVDLIYLDPPFNSNQNYAAPIGSDAAGAAFKDTWTLDDVDLAWHGEIAEQEPALYAIIDAAGLAHGPGMKAYLIMMSVRLLEMKRLLKETGSIYLHCDPTASHYLKMTMDCVFGRSEFRNELIWRRTTGVKGTRGKTKTFGTVSDSILFFAKTTNHIIRIPKVKDVTSGMRPFKHTDSNGRYRAVADLYGDAALHDCPKYEWNGHNPPYGWRVSKENLERLHSQDRIHYNRNGKPFRKQYVSEWEGFDVSNMWSDIPQAPRRERTGYPTQKPLKLLERIIAASSNPGDVVLDPFCGCATACVAAEKLGRQWVGIDISPKAAELVQLRLKKELGLFYNGAHRIDIPQRTDLGDIPRYNAPENKHALYGQQEGKCQGCLTLFPFRNLTVDHIIPQSKGGSDYIDNLQLLCGACNSSKGVGTQEQLIAKLQREGIRA